VSEASTGKKKKKKLPCIFTGERKTVCFENLTAEQKVTNLLNHCNDTDVSQL
jgi:hypothetical protein